MFGMCWKTDCMYIRVDMYLVFVGPYILSSVQQMLCCISLLITIWFNSWCYRKYLTVVFFKECVCYMWAFLDWKKTCSVRNKLLKLIFLFMFTLPFLVASVLPFVLPLSEERDAYWFANKQMEYIKSKLGLPSCQ